MLVTGNANIYISARCMPNMREKYSYQTHIFNRLSITMHNNMHFIFLGDAKKN